MPSRFRELIAGLAAVRVSHRAHNQYSDPIRRENLRLYLEELFARGSDTILIGEAPSHRGGRPVTRQTTIPASRALLKASAVR